MRGATGVTIQPRQILRLPRKMTLQDFKENLQKQVKRHFQCGADPTRWSSMIRAWSENENCKPQPASQKWLLCEVPRSIFYCKIQRFAPNLTVKLSPNTAPAAKSDTTTSPSTAPATKSATWTSPSTAPATKNDSTALSSSHMKRHFQCAEQQVSLSNLAKYCACHEKWHCKMSKKISKNRWNVISNAGPIRPWSDPSMIRAWKRKPQPASQVRLLCEVTRSIFYCKIQRFAPNLTVKLSPNTAPATKSDTTTSPSTAPATKSATWTSPSTAPATKNDSTALSSSHMKRHFQCAEQQVSLSNLAKYCACHEKWHCKMSKKISKNRWNVISNAGPIRPWSDHDPSMIRAWSENENANRNPPRKWGYFARSPEAFSIVKYNVLHPILQSNFHQILRLPRKVTLQLHQVLRLPRKVPLERHQVLHLPRKVTLELHQVVHLPRKVTLELHQVLRLPLHEVWRRLYLTLLDTTLLDSTLLDSTLLDTTLLDSTLLDSTLLDTTLLDSTLLDSTLLYLTLLYLTLLYLTLLYSTLLYLTTLLDSTLLDTTLLETTLLDSTLLDTTLLDLTLLRCRSYIGSFWAKLPLTKQ